MRNHFFSFKLFHLTKRICLAAKLVFLMNVLTSSAVVLVQSCQVGFVSQLQAMVTCSLDGEINICDVHTNQRGSELLRRFLQFFLMVFPC